MLLESSLFYVNEKIHLVNENQTVPVAVKMHWKQRCDVDSFREPHGRLFSCFGMCHQCFIRGCSSVPGIRELAPIQLFQQISIWTPGIPAPSWKGNTTIGDIDLLSICPRPQIGWHPFNCTAKTEMEEEIMEDITPWSCAKSAPSPSFPRMECWRIGGL